MRLLPLLIFSVASAGSYFTAGAAELSPVEVKEAQKMYVAKCAKCHEFYQPTGYQDAEWSDWMKKMSRKSKLKPAQEELLTRYLEVVRAEAKTVGASNGNGSKR